MSVPRFSFHLYVSVGEGREQLLPTIQAETFDIKDGALIFYQIITLDGKPVKAPVLSYASGAWLRVALLGKDGVNYVASSSEQSTGSTTISHQAKYPRPSPHAPHSGLPAPRANILAPTPTYAQNNQVKNEEWAQRLLDFHKSNSISFDLYAFKDYLQKHNVRYSEADWQWAAVNLIKSSQILPRYFTENHAQKMLDIHGKKTITSHWDGKINPILQLLNEREETKNITQVDLAVWLANNGLLKT